MAATRRDVDVTAEISEPIDQFHTLTTHGYRLDSIEGLNLTFLGQEEQRCGVVVGDGALPMEDAAQVGPAVLKDIDHCGEGEPAMTARMTE